MAERVTSLSSRLDEQVEISRERAERRLIEHLEGQTQIKVIEQSPIITLTAALAREYYTSLKDIGFTEEQSLRLVERTLHLIIPRS